VRLITVDCSYRTDATGPVDYVDGSTPFGEPMEPEIGSQAYGEFSCQVKIYAGRYDNGFSVKAPRAARSVRRGGASSLCVLFTAPPTPQLANTL